MSQLDHYVYKFVKPVLAYRMYDGDLSMTQPPSPALTGSCCRRGRILGLIGWRSPLMRSDTARPQVPTN